MKKLLIYFCVLALCFSCADKEKKALEKEEYEVITAMIEYQLKFTNKKGAVGAYMSKMNLDYNDETIRRLNKILDTAKVYVFFSDSLWTFNFKKGNEKIINGEIIHQFSYHGNEDSIYYPLVVKLADSVKTEEFQLPKIKSKYREHYVFEYDWNREFYPKNIFVIKNLTFSRVTFNKMRTRACIYVISSIEGYGLGGGGVIYFLKKENNKWIIETDKADLLWVS